MPFTFKLSVRLALIKAAAVGGAAVLAACEVPQRRPTEPLDPVVQIIISPDAVTLDPLQTRQFFAYGRTQAYDSPAVGVIWSVSGGGGGVSTSGLYSAPSAAGSYVVTA